MTRFLHTLLISGILALLVFASMGYLAVRLSWQGYVRSAKGMDRDLESHQFFCFSKESSRSLEWVEDDEFILNGSWYDVKHSTTHPDGYLSLVAYADPWEKYWLDCFFSWDDHGTGNENSSTVSAPQHWDWYYWFPNFTVLKPSGMPFNINLDSNCRILFRDFEGPPPKILQSA